MTNPNTNSSTNIQLGNEDAKVSVSGTVETHINKTMNNNLPTTKIESHTSRDQTYIENLTPSDHIQLIKDGVHSDYLHFLHILDQNRLENISKICQWHNLSAKSTILQMKSELKHYSDQRASSVKDAQLSMLYDNEVHQKHLLRSEDVLAYDLIADLPLPKPGDQSASHSYPEIADLCVPTEFETWFLQRQIQIHQSGLPPTQTGQNTQQTTTISATKIDNTVSSISSNNNISTPSESITSSNPNITQSTKSEHSDSSSDSKTSLNNSNVLSLTDLPMVDPNDFAEEYYAFLNSYNTLKESERIHRTMATQNRGVGTKVDVYLDTATAELVYHPPGDPVLRFSINSRLAVVGADSRRWPGEVIYIDPIEIHVRYDQGERARIYLDDLRTVRYRLSNLKPNPY